MMNELLLFTAAMLGALAFFEPCTIATHTLFAVRAHDKNPMSRLLDVFTIWLVRSLLLIFLFVLATQLTAAPDINATTASYVLLVMGSVYLISRKIYIPVPHLEFFRLLLFSAKLPHAVRLGLTAPACTLPLLVVSVNAFAMSIIAALLFSTLFSVPIFVAAVTGINESGRDFLAKAASGAPYLTAVLLFAAASYLMLPEIDLGRQALQTTFQQASVTGLGLAFLAGFVFSFNPVSFASIPVVLAYVTRAHEKRQALSLGGAFIFGLIVTHVMLGITAATGGEWVQSILGRHWGLFLGPVLIITGLM